MVQSQVPFVLKAQRYEYLLEKRLRNEENMLSLQGKTPQRPSVLIKRRHYFRLFPSCYVYFDRAMNNDQSSDSKIVRQCQRGDKAAFRQIVEGRQRIVFSLSLKMLADEEEAKDVVQETFLRAWQAIGRFDPQKSINTWLYTIATRLCLDRLKRRRLIVPLPDDERELRRFASDNNGQRQLENREWTAIVRLLAERLSEMQRLAFTLCQLEGLSLQEAETITGVSAKRLKDNLYVARQTIRKRLKELGYEED